MMHVSDVGRAKIEGFEGCVLHSYPDPATGGDPWTIGFGCTGPNIVPGLVITQAQADQMLSDRLTQDFEPGVMRAIGNAPTTQAQLDAMASIAFNIGVGAFNHSSVLRDHILGRYAAAAQAFLLWDRAAGRVLPALLRRRKEEAALYLSGAGAEHQNVPPDHPDAQPTPHPDIADAQRRLNAYGIEPPVTVDGLFGPETRDAIHAFQIDARLPATGLPDDATIAALKAAAA